MKDLPAWQPGAFGWLLSKSLPLGHSDASSFNNLSDMDDAEDSWRILDCHIFRMMRMGIDYYLCPIKSWFFSLIYMIHNLSLLPFFCPFSMQISRALRPFQCISLKLCSWHRWAPVGEVSCWKTTSLPNRVGTTLKDVQRWKLPVGCHTIHSLAVQCGAPVR